MTEAHYDVIIIGAGLSGLTIGAILGAEASQRVLILESQDYLGGRLVSFTGRGDRLILGGLKLGPDDFRRILASVYTWVGWSEPDLETIFRTGLLDGFSFEAGGHATFWGTRGRVGHLLAYLDKPVDLPGNEGFSVIDPETCLLHPMERGGRYGWMSEDSNRTAKRLLREMALASPEDLAAWDRISFGQWLNERTADRKVYEFLAAIASIHMVMGEPEMIPAGDFIRFMSTAGKIGMNLISGSTGIVPKPGFVYIAERLAEKVTESGGRIESGARVTGVRFEGGRVRGVEVGTAAGPASYSADRVVCTVPVKKIWSFLPKALFPEPLVKKVDEEFFSVGMLTGYVGLTSDPLAEAGLNPRSWLLAPSIIKASDGYIGDVDIVSIMPSNHSPTLAPPDKHTIAYSIALTDAELRDKAKVDRVIETAREIFHKTFHRLKEDTIWEIWTCSDKGFGDWPPPGDRRPDTVQPGLEGLFFAGDGYGADTWGSGMDAAIYSALLCVDAMTGERFVEKIMPEYHR
ncbi:MAG: FAD-dependent oxidoreductase [Proteobacteria bacterium]|nr:FAD-dependent oxidoreductase [Pseudomonadota bacterium]